jgi:hypothetical protein
MKHAGTMVLSKKTVYVGTADDINKQIENCITIENFYGTLI